MAFPQPVPPIEMECLIARLGKGEEAQGQVWEENVSHTDTSLPNAFPPSNSTFYILEVCTGLMPAELFLVKFLVRYLRTLQ